MSERRMLSQWRPPTFDIRSEEFRDLVRRSREVVLLAAITGSITGLVVRFFEYLVVEVAFHYVVEGPLWMGAVAPGIGLVLSAILLRTVGNGASSATADEYLRAFHDPEYPLRPRAFIGRMAAAVTTLGTGGPMGLEGPSIYGGSALGAMIQRRLPAAFRGADHRTLLVAGAAAGVAAIFKAPATGAIFALEVPFRDQMARRMLLPALVASASGYLVFVALSNVRPIFSFQSDGGAAFEYRDLAGAVLIGICCALGARVFSRMIRYAKGFTLGPIGVRVALASLILAVLFVISRGLTGESLTIGSGYEVIRWLSEEHALWLLAAVLVLRSVATATTVAGGGVGGLFIPLVVAGALVGRGVGDLVNPLDPTLYVLLGMAAFLGAGYRVPLAAVMFVAETTGQPGFIVPALFAAVAAELVMGRQSITTFQRSPEGTS
ncbi:MAG TPA: chloride channel protein [Ilumatobacteraceae bacterium]|nr:chloride channel protein [Ilumatobacteraceae bacterium]